MTEQQTENQDQALPTVEPDKKTREYLRYEFTDEELLALSQDLARLGREKRALEMQKAQVTKQLGGEIAAKDTELERIGNLVFEKAEYRNIDCGVFYDQPRKGLARIVRLDSGEVVRERRMTDDENQLQLELEAAAEAEAQPEPSATESVVESVAKEINNGALDTPGCKVTATVVKGKQR